MWARLAAMRVGANSEGGIMKGFYRQSLWLWMCVICQCGLLSGVANAEDSKRFLPSFVLITADTMRGDVAEVNGGPALTPALEEMAQTGWVFEKCFSTSMLTNPSHASIMTSTYSVDHGVYSNSRGISDEMDTIAELLKAAGYATGAVINFPHLNPNVSNLGQGFDKIIESTSEERGALEMAEVGLKVIMELRETNKPFFVWIHMTDPHAPYIKSHDYLSPKSPLGVSEAMYRVRKFSPGFQKNNEWFQRVFRNFRRTDVLLKRYVTEVEAVDTALARLRDGLGIIGASKSTYIVFTSDHGENLGERKQFFHHGGLYRETTHVPLLISGPKLEAKRIRELVQTIDIAPTILSMVGTKVPDAMRGWDLKPVVDGLVQGRDVVFSEHIFAQQVAARSKEGLLVYHRKDSGQFPAYPIKRGRYEYYDLLRDPDESKRINLRRKTARKLKQSVESFLKGGRKIKTKTPVDQDMASLRALGYLE